MDACFQINISLTVSKSGELVLSARNGNCVLPLVSEGNFFLNLPSNYDKLVTPINDAYLLIVAVIIFGGSWGCCMFRKRRRRDGLPYQELEMHGIARSNPWLLQIITNGTRSGSEITNGTSCM